MKLIILYGMSHAGLRIASYVKESGNDVLVAIESGSDLIPQLERLGIRVSAGDLRDANFLKSLEFEQAHAVILSSEDELFNLSAALDIVEINPEIRVVLRLYNRNLADKVESNIRNATVLSVSHIASPSFAAAALIEHPRLAFRAGEEIFTIYDVNGGLHSGARVSDIEDSQRVLTVNEEVFPDGNREIGKSDRITLFSSFETATRRCGIHACGSENRAEKHTRDIKKAFRSIDIVLVRTLLALLALFAGSVLYFHAAEHLGFLDAGYFVVTVLTTTGFGDINLKDSAAMSKLIGMGLMLAGMTLMAMLFAMITDKLLKKRLELFLGKRKIRLKDHVILCGMGDVGSRILDDLVRLGQKAAVVEKNSDGKFTQAVRVRNIPLIISDALRKETLVNANIYDAKAIICVTDNDLQNLEIGLNALSMRPGIRVVLRIFDKSFAKKIEKQFGIDVALSSSAIAAPVFASAAVGGGTIGIIAANGRRVHVKQAVVRDKTDLKSYMGRTETKVMMLVNPDGRWFLRELEEHVEQSSRIIFLAGQ